MRGWVDKTVKQTVEYPKFLGSYDISYRRRLDLEIHEVNADYTSVTETTVEVSRAEDRRVNESPIVTKSEASLRNVLGAWPQREHESEAEKNNGTRFGGSIQTPHTSINSLLATRYQR